MYNIYNLDFYQSQVTMQCLIETFPPCHPNKKALKNINSQT